MKIPALLSGFLGALLLAGCGAPLVENPSSGNVSSSPVSSSVATLSSAKSSALSSQAMSSSRDVRSPEVIARSLSIPWDIAFLPSGDFLVTERPGTLVRIGSDRKMYPIEGVLHRGEGGLLGIALHPDFAENHWIYLYLTTQTGQGTRNRIERYRFENDQLTGRTEIFGDIPGAANHDGGRIDFGPDGYLYVTTGDASQSSLAQETSSLAGKILRIRDDGSVPADNPFGNAVYSYGHRNPQGLVWDNHGRLWSTEHGRSGATAVATAGGGVQSGFDELNLIEKGANYGWPEIEGSETREGMHAPVLHSGADDTWAPASAAFHNGSIWFGGLRGEAIYQAVLDGATAELRTHLKGEFGRIRTIRIGPDGMLYATTSNTDGRGSAVSDDDRILRIDPASFVH